MDINAAKKEVIEWIQALDDEELISELYYFKERHRKVTPAEKKEYNRWLSELEYEPQLEALRSIIASAPTPDAIWNELSPEAQENLRTDEEVEKTDLQYTPAKFWDLVWSLRESEKATWDDLSEAEKESIERGLADAEAGRTIPHEEVMKEIEQRLNDMKINELLGEIVDLPVNMRARLADGILETLNRPGPEIDEAWAEEARRLQEYREGKVTAISEDEFEKEIQEMKAGQRAGGKGERNAKQDLIVHIQKMPDDVTIGEAMSELNYLYDIERSLKAGGKGSITQEELKARVKKNEKNESNEIANNENNTHKQNIYAYDGYVLDCARQYRTPLLSLDHQMKTLP